MRSHLATALAAAALGAGIALAHARQRNLPNEADAYLRGHTHGQRDVLRAGVL